MSKEQPATIPHILKFMFAGMAGKWATIVVHPLELVKTRMQIAGAGSGKRQYRNTWHCLQNVVSYEGPLALYDGLRAALLRQSTYTSGRLGVYSLLVELYTVEYGTHPKVVATMGMGVVAGAFGGFIGTPAEVVMIRMATEGCRAPADRHNYTSPMNALWRISRDEGITALWLGGVPTVVRAMIVNMIQLASYSQFKNYLTSGPLHMEKDTKLYFAASMGSGLLTTIASMPFDIAKTRMQSKRFVERGKVEYKGTLDVMLEVAQHEGVPALWKGFTPYLCRLGPHTVLTFLFLEQINAFYLKHFARCWQDR